MKSLKYNGPKNPGVWVAALGQLALDAASAEDGQAGVGQMKWRLESVLAGLAEVSGATDAAHRPAADALKEAIESLTVLTPNTPEETIEKALKEGRDEILKALQALRK